MELLRQVPVPNSGARFEARVFAAIYHLPYVTRSAEFANVDGVLDCAIDPSSAATSFADRFFALVRRAGALSSNSNPCVLVPFDVKSSTSHEAQDQKYRTTVDQRRYAAFYICFCAADPGFVEVIPNGLAGELLAGGKHAAVNRSCEALVTPRAYQFLSPCNALYRMPLELLPVALNSIRSCALDPSLRYTNPWTQACFRKWRPALLSSVERLIPNEDTQQAQFTAYEGTARIQRAIRNARTIQNIAIHFDFILHQPQLADFKLITPFREALVQYKIDYRRRYRISDLGTVEVARTRHIKGKHGKPAKEHVAYYFTAFERFDYLLYEFQFPAKGEHAKPDQWETWFFFLPEKVLPDRFYTTQGTKDSFADTAFDNYWLRMDPAGDWVEKVYAIIQANPEPRRPGDRPLRNMPSKREEGEQGKQGEQGEQGEQEEEPLEDASTGAAPAPRHLGWFYEQFYKNIMDCCTRRMSGLLTVLARDHPLGDFAYCRYRWSQLEQKTYMDTGWPPSTLHHLSAHTPVVPISVFARQRVGTMRGPSLTAVEARRLSSYAAPRILCFDLFGAIGKEARCPLLIVPSDDVSHTSAQRTRYEEVLATNKKEEFTDRVPRLAEQLHTKSAIADYTVAACGPMIFEPNNDAWMEAWALLDKFSGSGTFYFPESTQRHAERYQLSVQELHQHLADEYEELERIFLERSRG